MITGESVWREIPGISLQTFIEEIKRYEEESGRRTIVLPVAKQFHHELQPYSALGLAMLAKECQYGAVCEGRNLNNPFNISCGWRPPNIHTWCQYSSPVESAKAWKRAIESYDAVTLSAMLRTYAPCSENDCATYLKQTVDRINRYLASEETMDSPVIYNLANRSHQERFGLQQWQANEVLSHYFPNRCDGASGICGEPQFIVLHIQDGNTTGSLTHWTTVDASSTVMIQKDGSILRIIPENHGPWTNGDVINPTAQSAALRNKGGNPNIWCLTIEAEGKPWDQMPQSQFQSIVWQCRQWMKTYNIPLKNILPHSSINGRDRQNCPGPYYSRVIGELTSGENQNGTPSSTFPTRLELPVWNGNDIMLAGARMYACRRNAVLARDYAPRKYADEMSAAVGPPIKKGTQIAVAYLRRGADRQWWYCSESAGFVPASATDVALSVVGG